MQTLHYTVGNWRAQAQLEELEPGKLMAVIDVTAKDGAASGSRHTVVFEQEEGIDKKQQTENLVRRLLQDHHRM